MNAFLVRWMPLSFLLDFDSDDRPVLILSLLAVDSLIQVSPTVAVETWVMMEVVVELQELST